MSNFIIEQATLQDMRFLLDSASVEGWNPGVSDGPPFYFEDPLGFFVGRIDGELIGCISAVSYGADYGFMGFYIVLPSFRGKGYGMRLWNHALAYLEGRCIGLDGVVAQQENYKKSGFSLSHNNLRMKGSLKGERGACLKSIEAIPFPVLVEFDKAVFGVGRGCFLQHWITMPDSHGLVKIQDGQLSGYGVIRKCGLGYKVGPLFADDVDVANEILLGLAASCQTSPIFLDVVQSNHDALALAKEYGFEPVFETARMYRGSPPKQLLSKVFGVTTFELG